MGFVRHRTRTSRLQSVSFRAVFWKFFHACVFRSSFAAMTVTNGGRPRAPVAVRVCTPTLPRATVFRHEVGRSADTGVVRCARAAAAFPVRPPIDRRAIAGQAFRGLHNRTARRRRAYRRGRATWPRTKTASPPPHCLPLARFFPYSFFVPLTARLVVRRKSRATILVHDPPPGTFHFFVFGRIHRRPTTTPLVVLRSITFVYLRGQPIWNETNSYWHNYLSIIVTLI